MRATRCPTPALEAGAGEVQYHDNSSPPRATSQGRRVRRPCVLCFARLTKAAVRPVCGFCEATVRADPNRSMRIRRSPNVRRRQPVKAGELVRELTDQVLHHRRGESGHHDSTTPQREVEWGHAA